MLPSDQHEDQAEDSRFHALFRVLREHTVRASEGFRERLHRRVERVEERRAPVEPTRVVAGSLLELVNMLVRLLRGGAEPSVPRQRVRRLRGHDREGEDGGE